MLLASVPVVFAQTTGQPGPVARSAVPTNPVVTSTKPVTKLSEIPPDWVPPTPDSLNGLPINAFIIMPPNVIDNVRAIYRHGQDLGRYPFAFGKIGDSTIEYPYFLQDFDKGRYTLGVYDYLQVTIDQFKGSFVRRSAAVKVGQHAWTVLNPNWANSSQCKKNETPVACELRLANPIVVLIRLGPNDAGNLKLFEKNFKPVIEYVIAQGVIPVLSTKADRQAGMTDINNLMRQWAAEYQVPLWDLDVVMEKMPKRGLWTDGVHMSAFSPLDLTNPLAYQRGHAMQNLTALMMLDNIRRAVSDIPPLETSHPKREK